MNVSMRAEPDTDMETCCVNNNAMGWKCDPDNCQRRIQNDETALATDVGYYIDFDVDAETGRPKGCPSFDAEQDGGLMKNTNWRNSKVVDCEKQNYAPEGEPLYQIVDEFADDQAAWFRVNQLLFDQQLQLSVQNFLTAFDKMSNNGYNDGDLTEGPTNWIGATCKTQRVRGKGKIWICEN